MSSQCPVLDSEAHLKARDLVQVDPQTGARRFEAKIVGIFSCLDGSDSASNDLTLDFRLAKPVIDLAVRAVNSKFPNMHFNVTYRTAPDICKHQRAAGHAADEFYVNGANYLVGPGCSESLASVGQLASYWNLPMCSTGYLPEIVTARFKPLTLMQISLSVQSVGEMLLELFQMYKWRHLVIVTDEKHPLHSLIRDGLLEFFHTMYMPTAGLVQQPLVPSGAGATLGSLASSGPLLQPSMAPMGSATLNQATQPRGTTPANNNARHRAHCSGYQNQHTHQQQRQQPQQQHNHPYYINITSRSFAYSKNKPVDYEQVMLDAAGYSRVMLLLARNSIIGNLLEAAHNQGMSKGQFVFIAHELFETQMFEASPTQQPGAAAFENENLEQTLKTGAPINKQRYALDDKIEIQSLSGNATTDQTLKEIFQPLMTISLRIPTTPEFDTFRSEVAGLSEREFNYRIQPTSLKSLYSLGLAAFIYDCVMLYADKVDYVLNQTNMGKIDGKTIFGLSAGNTFTGALTGDLTFNKAGQRVIDFTLNDFSPKSLSLEPIAHFKAIERCLVFLPGKQPHWYVRNQSTPRSDPRCRINEMFCRYSDDDSDLLLSNYHLGSTADRMVLGVWLLVIIILSVTLTSSFIGWLVYRRFRIESELLNLWWSIKYEDILFEDESDAMCDGKRSMSSLAISNESFNEAAVGCAGSATGRLSPLQQRPDAVSTGQAAEVSDNGAKHLLGADCQRSAVNLNVCHSLDNQTSNPLAAAHSTSTLSVTAPSLGGSTPGLNVATNEPAGGGASGQPAAEHHRSERAKMGHVNSGASKLIPLINKGTTGGSRSAGGGQTGSGKFAGSSGQLGAGGKPTGQRGVTSGGGLAAGGAANIKDPSISSQNKNAKFRLGTVLNGGRDQTHTTKVGMYKASRVAAKHLNVRNLNINRQLLIELRQVRDLTHENLIKFIGLCPEEPNIALISELCTRGNLQDLLQNETIRLDWPFRYSIINDIVDGLIHLHSSPIQYHGRLKSSNCVIDNRFVVKLTDFGLPTLLAAVELEETVNPRLLLWTAPEHLRTKHPLLSGSQKGDIYSLAIIFQEIITRCGPFECEPILCGASEVGASLDWSSQPRQQQQSLIAPIIRTTDAGGQLLGGSAPAGRRGGGGGGQAGRPSQQNINQQQNINLQTLSIGQAPVFQPIVVQHKQRLEPEEIVNLVRMGLSPPFRPYFRPDVASSSGTATGDFNVGDLIAVVQNCWQEAPASRPSVANVKQQIKKMRRGCHLDGTNLMDNLLQRMERYTDNLESLVEQKTAELMEEKKRSEELLYEMLPRFVVDQLKYGHSVTPEAYEAVTISFSDIKDFTSIAAQSSPIEVVNLLNQLYTEFDDCIARYDVYKVETIGDAYMVVSGLPVRNGDQHAREIAEMSLALLDLIRNFDVVHLPHVDLELRIGIHSGPCASGVVGTRMFRYCLFGDTVSRQRSAIGQRCYTGWIHAAKICRSAWWLSWSERASVQ